MSTQLRKSETATNSSVVISSKRKKNAIEPHSNSRKTKRVKYGNNLQGGSTKNVSQTVKLLQEEINKYKKKPIFDENLNPKWFVEIQNILEKEREQIKEDEKDLPPNEDTLKFILNYYDFLITNPRVKRKEEII